MVKRWRQNKKTRRKIVQIKVKKFKLKIIDVSRELRGSTRRGLHLRFPKKIPVFV